MVSVWAFVSISRQTHPVIVVLSLPNVVFIMLLPSSVRAGHGRLLWLGNFKQVRVES